MLSTNRYDSGVLDGPFAKDGDVRSATTDVDERHSKFFFVLAQDGECRGQLLKHDITDV